jgi:acylglycerol lipase
MPVAVRGPLRPAMDQTWALPDGSSLAGRVWTPPERADHSPWRGAVLYLHGIQSHGGWFEWSASVLADAGLPVALPDRRGSGRNAAGRGDVNSDGDWLADLDELYLWMCEHWSVRRIAVVGVSWGGKLALAWARRRPGFVHRILLIAPGLFPQVDVGAATRLKIGISLLRSPTKTYPIPLDDPALFSDHPPAQNFIARDPQKLTHATARWLYQSALLDRRWRALRPGQLTMPVDLLLADRDRIIDNARTERFLRRVAGEHLTVQRLDAAHTLEFEPSETAFEAALRTFANRCQARATTGQPSTSSLSEA